MYRANCRFYKFNVIVVCIACKYVLELHELKNNFIFQLDKQLIRINSKRFRLVAPNHSKSNKIKTHIKNIDKSKNKMSWACVCAWLFSLSVLFLVCFLFLFFCTKHQKCVWLDSDDCMLVPSFERNQYVCICVCMSGKFNFERFVSWLDLIYFRISLSLCFLGEKSHQLTHSFIHWVRLRRINEAHISFFTDFCKK